MDHPHSDYLYLVKGIDGSRQAWYYILVDQDKVDRFLEALNRYDIHLENYGKILYSAYGEEPPLNITERVKKECGIN
jgi:hypothetical protein